MKNMTQASNNSNILHQILVRIQSAQAQNQQTLAVFDLDSTLFDVSPRIQQILNQFAENPVNQKKFPESCEIMKSCRTIPSDWGIKNALVRAGLDGAHPDFHKALKDFWMSSFFSNEFLEYDLPYDGAANYVERLHQLGTEIVYLTGRDVARMQTGTISVLRKWNFPVEVERAKAVLKPEKGMDDALFKSEFFAQLNVENYPGGIWFFENEPMNINLVLEHHNHVEIIFFESTHAGKAVVQSELPKIMHYLL